MDFEKNEKKLGVLSAENTLEPTTDAHENDESDGIYVMEALSEKGERKVTPDELIVVMQGRINTLFSLGKTRTHKEMENELKEEFKFDTVTGEPLESKVIEIAIRNAMKHFDRKIESLDESR